MFLPGINEQQMLHSEAINEAITNPFLSLRVLDDEKLYGQFPVSGICRAGGIFDDKRLLSRNYLFNFRVTFSPAKN